MGLEAIGVEVVSLRWSVACQVLARLRSLAGQLQQNSADKMPSLTFVHASLTELDWSDADIVFANSVSFTPELMEALAHGARKLKPGSIVICAKRPRLLGPGLRLVKRFVGPTGWTNDT